MSENRNLSCRIQPLHLARSHPVVETGRLNAYVLQLNRSPGRAIFFSIFVAFTSNALYSGCRIFIQRSIDRDTFENTSEEELSDLSVPDHVRGFLAANVGDLQRRVPAEHGQRADEIGYPYVPAAQLPNFQTERRPRGEYACCDHSRASSRVLSRIAHPCGIRGG